MKMGIKAPSLNYFLQHGASNLRTASALLYLTLQKIRDRLGIHVTDETLQRWLPTMVGEGVNSKDFRSDKRIFFDELISDFVNLITEVEAETIQHEEKGLDIYIHDNNVPSMHLKPQDVDWKFYKEKAEEFFAGEKRSFIHLAERNQLQTLSELYGGFPLKNSNFTYIRRSSDENETSYAVGLFQIHDYLDSKNKSSAKFFSFLSSSATQDSKKRNLFLEVGDLLSSGSVVSAITSHESDVIDDETDLGSIFKKDFYDKPIFRTVDEIRSFNFKIISSSCMRGVAFIKDYDYQTAVTPCVAFPIEAQKWIDLDYLRRARNEGEIRDLLESHCSTKDKTASKNALDAYFASHDRIVITEPVASS